MNPSRSVRRRLLIVAIVLGVFSLTGFVILPPIVKTQVEKRASAMLGRRVTVETIRLNPYALSITLRNFAIAEADGTTRFLGWRSLYVNFDALGSLWGEWVLSDVALDGFSARGVMNADGSLNVSDLLAKLAPTSSVGAAPASAPPRPVRIGRLRVTDARIEALDSSRHQPFATTIGPLTFDLTDFRTAGPRGAPYHFQAVTEAGEKFSWSGTLRAEPFLSRGEFQVENLVLAKYAPYYADRIQADVAAGNLSVRGRYEIDLTKDHRIAKLQETSVALRGLIVRERGADLPALELPAADVAGVTADALAMKAEIGAITAAGGHVRIRRERDGRLNLLTMVQPAAETPRVPSPASAGPTAREASAVSAPAVTAPGKLPDVMIGEVALKDFQAEITDAAAPRPAQLAVTGLQFSLKNVTLAEGAKMPLDVSFGWAPQGAVRLAGTIGLSPIQADVQCDVAEFALLPLSPYLEQFANVHLTQGAITSKLKISAMLEAGKPPSADVAGDITIDHVGLVDGVRNEELAGYRSLALRGLRASAKPELSVALDELAITAPYARAIVGRDKTLNLLSVTKPAASAASVSPVAPSAATTTGASNQAGVAPVATTVTQPKIEIAKITVSEGDFRFSDQSFEPAVAMAVTQFGGTITGLSASNPTKADVDLKAMVDGAGPVAITGKLDPLNAHPTVDLKIDVKNVDLLPLSPYSGKFAGYELARGKLLVDVKLAVDGKKIDAANVITLNQFTFGNPVSSPDATKLPVRLGVALLKDIDGKIVIDVPIQGRTDDPEFRIGRVVLRVIVNLLTKAAVSPFALLGSAFGGGGEELAFQEFAPGLSDLQPAAVQKLDTMVKAMTNRPGLSLGIEGSYDTAADGYALKRAKLAERVRRAVWEAKRQQNPNLPPPAELVITPEENAAMIKTLFDAAFPPGTQFGTPLPPPPVVTAPPPAPPPRGLVARVMRALSFSAKRAERKAADERARLAAEHQQAVAAAKAAGLPLEEMAGRLAEAITIEEHDLRALAQARAQQVRDYLAGKGNIAPDRLFLSQEESRSAAAGKGPRVFLTLQ